MNSLQVAQTSSGKVSLYQHGCDLFDGLNNLINAVGLIHKAFTPERNKILVSLDKLSDMLDECFLCFVEYLNNSEVFLDCVKGLSVNNSDNDFETVFNLFKVIVPAAAMKTIFCRLYDLDCCQFDHLVEDDANQSKVFNQDKIRKLAALGLNLFFNVSSKAYEVAKTIESIIGKSKDKGNVFFKRLGIQKFTSSLSINKMNIQRAIIFNGLNCYCKFRKNYIDFMRQKNKFNFSLLGIPEFIFLNGSQGQFLHSVNYNIFYLEDFFNKPSVKTVSYNRSFFGSCSDFCSDFQTWLSSFDEFVELDDDSLKDFNNLKESFSSFKKSLSDYIGVLEALSPKIQPRHQVGAGSGNKKSKPRFVSKSKTSQAQSGRLIAPSSSVASSIQKHSCLTFNSQPAQVLPDDEEGDLGAEYLKSLCEFFGLEVFDQQNQLSNSLMKVKGCFEDRLTSIVNSGFFVNGKLNYAEVCSNVDVFVCKWLSLSSLKRALSKFKDMDGFSEILEGVNGLLSVIPSVSDLYKCSVKNTYGHLKYLYEENQIKRITGPVVLTTKSDYIVSHTIFFKKTASKEAYSCEIHMHTETMVDLESIEGHRFACIHIKKTTIDPQNNKQLEIRVKVPNSKDVLELVDLIKGKPDIL